MSGTGREVAGRFLLGRVVADGGTGRVFRAVDASTGGDVALKVQLVPDAEARRFLREARVLELLMHPGIVRHVAHGLDAEVGCYLAMEWIEGESLAARLARGPLEPPVALTLIRRLAAAVAAAHELGVVHRDLKPANVMLRGGDASLPMLIDFGAMRRANDGAEHAASTLVGTPGYMPPEQVAGVGVDARADVFALGAIAFECLSGRPAFDGTSALERLASAARDVPPHLDAQQLSLPAALTELLRRMLRADPDARPRDASRVVRELEAIEAAGATPPAERTEATSERRLLLGRSTPTVGRDAELGALRALAEASLVGDAGSRVVLLSGPAGIGKSRVRHELGAWLGSHAASTEIWIGRGEPGRLGSPFGVIASALCASAGLRDGDAPELQRAELERFLSRFVEPADGPGLLEVLSELCGVSGGASPSVRLLAARQDPRLMADQITRAWVDLLRAVSTRGGLALVLEDLHWGDLGSVKLVDAVLEGLPERAILVVACARPDVHERFPGLWARRDLFELRLGPLSTGSAQEMVRSALGSELPEERVSGIVDRAGGNALFLEELIRDEATGAAGGLPAGVSSMLESRLARLEPEARRVLQAASVFGTSFWPSGVSALCAGEDVARSVPAWLAALEDREIVGRRPESRVAGQREYVFRHALVREVAYASATDSERCRGHALAAEWLEARGAHDAAMLADHFARGDAQARAVKWWRRAAELALSSTDLEGARQHAERALAHAVGPEERGQLELLLAETWNWSGAYARALRPCERALELLPAGSSDWCEAAVLACEAQDGLGDAAGLRALADRLLAAPSIEPAALAVAAARAVTHLWRVGESAGAEQLLARVDLGAIPVDQPRRRAFVHRLRAQQGFHQGEFGKQLSEFEAAVRCFADAGDRRWLARDQSNLGYGYGLLGELERAERVLDDARATARALGLGFLAQVCEHNLGLVLGRLGRIDEARHLESHAAAFFVEQASPRLAGFALTYLARVELWRPDPAAAARAAERAAALFAEGAPQVEAYALSARAEAELKLGRVEQAREHAVRAMSMLVARGGSDEGESYMRLVHAEVTWAAGEKEGARDAIVDARDRLMARASRLPPPFAEPFLHRIEEHARTLRLAGEWAPGR